MESGAWELYVHGNAANTNALKEVVTDVFETLLNDGPMHVGTSLAVQVRVMPACRALKR
jgi:hypothetical protein